MSDNDNYWSDENESDNELIQDSRELPPMEIDSEEEEEYRNILTMVSDKLKDKEDSVFDYKNKDVLDIHHSKKNNSKKKKINSKIILDFNSDNTKKKVWHSKRMCEKKGPEIVKRKFNPRLPPPGNKFKNIIKQKDVSFNLVSDFPSL